MSENLHRAVMETAHTIVNSAAGGTIALIPAVAAQRVGLYRMVLVVPSTVTVTFQDTSAAAVSAPYAFGASGGSLVLDIQANGDPWFQTGFGLGLQLAVSAAVQVSADIYTLQGP